MNNLLVSVIITTKNEEKSIGRLIASIKKQTYPYIEIIVVDNNSTDDTIKIVKKYGNVFLHNFGPERSAQRNYGAKESKGQLLLFLDADMELTKNVITECVEKIKKNNKTGAIVIPERSFGKKFWEKVKTFERSFYNESGDTTTDAARFFKKEVFFKVGGYNEMITGPEDWDLPERIKEKGFYIDRIISKIYHHETIDSIWDLAFKKYYYALKSHIYLKRHKISLISPKTIYFLRPIFYKNWKKLIKNPVLFIAMFFMFFIELIAGGIGFFVGKYTKANK